jgi:phosphoribosylformylglycinamidine synthase subunit PurL
LMISESQERMLFVVDPLRLSTLQSVLEKYQIAYSVIGKVEKHRELIVRANEKVIAQMPSSLVAHAPLLNWPSRKPSRLENDGVYRQPGIPKSMANTLLSLLSNPTIASKKWIYQQYDHEVGIRTVAKPGSADAAILRLDRNDKFLSVKLDGNSKHCYLDPYQGTLGLMSEGRRNVICTGADPIGVVDHLQFASPADPEVFWTFQQAIAAIIDYCKFMEIPVVGGKVSFYNENSKGPIKPTPVIGTLGLIDRTPYLQEAGFSEGEAIFVVGETLPELGGSEYYEYIHKVAGGPVPRVNLAEDKKNGEAVLSAIRQKAVSSAHDCSKGGLAVALSEMAILGNTGYTVDLADAPNDCARLDELLFSESNSRYLLGTTKPENLRAILDAKDVRFAKIGVAAGNSIIITKAKKRIIRIALSRARERFYSLEKVMH